MKSTSANKASSKGKEKHKSKKTKNDSNEDNITTVSLEQLEKEATIFGTSRSFPSIAFFNFCIRTFFVFLFVYAFVRAYTVRMVTVERFGRLIHEFDPWFNYRAAEYLDQHGSHAFLHWFDEMSWYPIGRPVGTTIYPGLQYTAVGLRRALSAFGVEMSLNDVCVFIPAWFGSLATLFAALLAYECTNSFIVASTTAFFYAMNPAHLFRSVAGAFDNECIALAAMLLTFYLWVRSLRCPRSWPIGLAAGVAYGYMVAAWGGFIFVLNMIVLHAGLCAMVDWARGTYNPSLLRAYTLFYVVGTLLAMQVPPVNTTPFKSVEQLSGLLVFVGLWSLHFAESYRVKRGLAIRSAATFRLRVLVLCVMLAGLVSVALLVAPSGFFRPISSRVRALFVAHTRTGNPLVDSVAEHRPLGLMELISHLHVPGILWVVGIAMLIMRPTNNRRAGLCFLYAFSVVILYFCGRMSRLVVLASPAACICAATVIDSWVTLVMRLSFFNKKDSASVSTIRWNYIEPYVKELEKQKEIVQICAENYVDRTVLAEAVERHAPAALKKDKYALAKVEEHLMQGTLLGLPTRTRVSDVQKKVPNFLEWGFLSIAFSFIFFLVAALVTFEGYNTATSMDPQITFYYDNGYHEPLLITDILDSYIWLKNHTPEDARILSWWDYGYQITGIANRTTLADGNTWNHEHIATIGKMLTSPVGEAHAIIRHMADYVYIWAGQSGDLGKSPHMARIGNSVYRDICAENDPLCTGFGFHQGKRDRPTPSMKRSLLYNLHEHRKRNDTVVDDRLFEEVYTSKNNLVRIFKVMNVSEESKQWVADRRNHPCQPSPDEWICPGQYPPAKEVQDMIKRRITFQQLEAFSHDKKKDKYYQAYMAQFDGAK